MHPEVSESFLPFLSNLVSCVSSWLEFVAPAAAGGDCFGSEVRTGGNVKGVDRETVSIWGGLVRKAGAPPGVLGT